MNGKMAAFFSLGMGIGLCLGAAIGMGIGIVGMGLSLGAIIGLGLGIIFMGFGTPKTRPVRGTSGSGDAGGVSASSLLGANDSASDGGGGSGSCD